jgi:hypothetical protein
VAAEPRQRRELPELLIGLVAIALAIAIAIPITAAILGGAVRDVKRQRDTISVTGSARHPIEANLAIWRLTVSAKKRTPAAAAQELRRKVAAVDKFLADGGLQGDEIRKPPLSVEATSFSVPTGRRRPAFRQIPAWRVAQSFAISTGEIESLEELAGRVDELLIGGIDVSVESVQYLSTQLTDARFAALEKATADARRRAETIASGLGGDLGAVRKVDLGVYQIVPRNSTEVSDYGINDTGSREKEVVSVVTVTFAVDR